MEITITIITLLIFGGLLLSPLIIFKLLKNTNSKFVFVLYMTIGIFFTAIISLIFGWWTHKSNVFLLEYYNGYHINPDSNSGQIYYETVLPKNMERVKELEKSYMGIGWPLKSIFLFVFFLPYLLIAYFVKYLIDKNRINKSDKIQTEK